MVVSAIVAGPEMDAAQVRNLISDLDPEHPIEFMDFSDNTPALIAAADLVVSMAGYNTINEILCFRKKAIVIPRIRPRTEQLIRSRRLEELGLIEMIHPGQLSPEALSEKMNLMLTSETYPDPRFLEFNAVDKIIRELQLLMPEQPNVLAASMPRREEVTT
jgi:predicted glycosyltransferase